MRTNNWQLHQKTALYNMYYGLAYPIREQVPLYEYIVIYIVWLMVVLFDLILYVPSTIFQL